MKTKLILLLLLLLTFVVMFLLICCCFCNCCCYCLVIVFVIAVVNVVCLFEPHSGLKPGTSSSTVWSSQHCTFGQFSHFKNNLSFKHAPNREFKRNQTVLNRKQAFGANYINHFIFWQCVEWIHVNKPTREGMQCKTLKTPWAESPAAREFSEVRNQLTIPYGECPSYWSQLGWISPTPLIKTSVCLNLSWMYNIYLHSQMKFNL